MTMQLVHVMEPPEPGDDRSPGAVLRNENGAMLIVGIFMVMFIAAMLYYVVGIGDTVTYRERMQDAADAGAMTGAIFMARGMNIITLMNLTLASVFGVLIAAQTAFFLILAAMGNASSKCSFPWGIPHCIAAICFALMLPEACNKIDEAKGIVDDAADVTTGVQESVRNNMGYAAIAVVGKLGMDHYDPPVTIPLGAYTPMDLPVQPDPSPPICERTILPWEKGGFPLMSWIFTSMNSQDLADDIAGSCGSSYLNAVEGSAFFLTWVSCWMQEGHASNKLYRVNPDANLGDENFQFHTLMTGEPPYGLGDENEHTERVSVGAWDREEDGGGFWGTLAELSRFSVAQAEFLWDDDGDREDYLWELKWRARLRRFRCTQVSGPFGSICSDRLDNAFLH
tara:strand:+ start:1935 stop:3122 length:1188 start_codon:yes stop_codon:yes gene_type:complete